MNNDFVSSSLTEFDLMILETGNSQVTIFPDGTGTTPPVTLVIVSLACTEQEE